uniref:Ig-like domain-containing protein n=1 Tax=Catharus ustulatus TaxID=91951 RepID=A0A8C3U4F8_CATUS
MCHQPQQGGDTKLPQLVALDPVPALPVGHIHPLTCHVLDVAPLGNLTVTLRRGTETLRTATFGDSEGSASVAVSHELPVARGDHGQAVTCHAELSLRPHGPLFARGAAPVVLSVFDLPEPPHLEAPPILEVATLANATCHLIGAFPVTDINITVTLGGDPLDVTTVTHGDKVTTRAELAPLRPGHHELSCTAQVATPLEATSKPPRATSKPLGDTSEPLGDTSEPPPVRLQLRDGRGRVLAEGSRPRLQLRVVARRGDNGGQMLCRASLEVGGAQVTKEATARLEVLYPPEFPPRGCPSNRTWLRGTLEALSCLATGNPSPTVLCGHHGATVATTEPSLVTDSRAGTYECKATNALGTRRTLKMVTFMVALTVALIVALMMVTLKMAALMVTLKMAALMVALTVTFKMVTLKMAALMAALMVTLKMAALTTGTHKMASLMVTLKMVALTTGTLKMASLMVTFKMVALIVALMVALIVALKMVTLKMVTLRVAVMVALNMASLMATLKMATSMVTLKMV